MEPYTGVIDRILKDDLGAPGSSATPPSASSSGCRMSTGSAADTPSQGLRKRASTSDQEMFVPLSQPGRGLEQGPPGWIHRPQFGFRLANAFVIPACQRIPRLRSAATRGDPQSSDRTWSWVIGGVERTRPTASSSTCPTATAASSRPIPRSPRRATRQSHGPDAPQPSTRPRPLIRPQAGPGAWPVSLAK